MTTRPLRSGEDGAASSDARHEGRPRSGPPLLALQVARFAAASLVLLHHAGYDADTVAARLDLAPLNVDRYIDGSFGVHLFFVLSGFILVYAERDFGRPGEPVRFMIRRIVRVVPLYWLMTLLLLVGALAVPSLLNTPVGGWRGIVCSFLFIPVARGPGETHPILGQGWTLNYEMLFYVGFALAMTRRRSVGLALLAAGFAALVVLGWMARPTVTAFQVWTDPLLFEFLFGVGIALAYLGGLRVPAVAALLLVAGGLAGAVAPGPLATAASLLPAWIAQGVPAALILAGLGLGPAWPATPGVLFFAALGDASYSLYLVHPFAIRPLRDVWLAVGRHLPLGLYLIVAFAVAVAVSLLLYRLVEKPCTRLLRRKIGRGSSPALPASHAAASVRPFSSSSA